MKIYGAGIAGLLAANAFPTAQVFEAGPEGSTTHKALLRFRSSAVGDAVGIDFKKVRVHKGIWHEGRFMTPNIQLANLYSQKVIGRIADRSIWNLDSVDRYIAPEDFIEQLVDRCRNRITYDAAIGEVELSDRSKESEPVISTIPMPVLANYYSGKQYLQAHNIEFKSAPIHVVRFRVFDCEAYQTIYFPGKNTGVYRASITGDMLIIEVADGHASFHLEEITTAFGIDLGQIDEIEKVSQRFGKIASINDKWRRRFIFETSHDQAIYSLGRFATWRNILLDDVLKDINVIKKLMNGTSYERKLAQ